MKAKCMLIIRKGAGRACDAAIFNINVAEAVFKLSNFSRALTLSYSRSLFSRSSGFQIFLFSGLWSLASGFPIFYIFLMQLAQEYADQIIQSCRSVFDPLPGNVVVYLFGSRARAEAHRASDVDLAIESDFPLGHRITIFRDLLHESTIPYEADVIDLATVDRFVKENVLREGKVLWQKQSKL